MQKLGRVERPEWVRVEGTDLKGAEEQREGGTEIEMYKGWPRGPGS